MLVIFAVIIGGIIAGRLLSSWRLVFVSRMITVIIWLLLFLLGLEVGSDPAVVGGMATLGRTAFVIFACSVAGSICMSWLLWRCVRRGTASRPPAEGMPEQAVALGLQGAVVDGLGLLDLAVRPLTDQLGRSQTDFNGIERVISHNLESSSCIRVIRQNRRRRSCPLRRNHRLHRLLQLRCRMRRDRCLHLPRR